MPQIFKQLSLSNSKDLFDCVLYHCYKDSFTLLHTHAVPCLRRSACASPASSAFLAVWVLLFPHALCERCDCSGFLCLCKLLVHSPVDKPLSKFTSMHQKCVWLLFASFIVAILAGVENSQCLTGIWAALPDLSRGHSTVRAPSDHVRLHLGCYSFCFPLHCPCFANFCASQPSTASQANSRSSRLVGSVWAIM